MNYLKPNETTEMTVREAGMTELEMRSPAVHLSNERVRWTEVVQRSRNSKTVYGCLASEKHLNSLGRAGSRPTC